MCPNTEAGELYLWAVNTTSSDLKSGFKKVCNFGHLFKSTSFLKSSLLSNHLYLAGYLHIALSDLENAFKVAINSDAGLELPFGERKNEVVFMVDLWL